MKIYVQKVLDGRNEISAIDLPLESEKDLLALLSAAVYAKQNGYELVLGTEYLRTGNACVRDFSFRRLGDNDED